MIGKKQIIFAVSLDVNILCSLLTKLITTQKIKRRCDDITAVSISFCYSEMGQIEIRQAYSYFTNVVRILKVLLTKVLFTRRNFMYVHHFELL